MPKIRIAVRVLCLGIALVGLVVGVQAQGADAGVVASDVLRKRS